MKNWLTNNWKLVALIIGIGLMASMQLRIVNLRDEVQLKAVELSSVNDSLITYATKYGILVTKVNSVIIDKDNLKESLRTAGFNIRELKDENIRLRRVTNALKLKLETKGTVETATKDTFYIKEEIPGKIDTVWFNTFAPWTNNYLSIYNGKIMDNLLMFDYDYRTQITLVQEERRKQAIITATLTDPNARIIAGNSITVNKKTPWYEKWWLWGAAGFVGGTLLAK